MSGAGRRASGACLECSLPHPDQEDLSNPTNAGGRDVAREQESRDLHWLHMDRPEEFNRILDEFLAHIDEKTL
jgi:pimeloyl-ACP methyl ester carboxylesterase